MRILSPGMARIVAALALSQACGSATAQTSEFQTHLDAAKLNAGSDPFFTSTLVNGWCTGPLNGAPPELSDRAVVPPTQIFDDVWYLGFRNVGQYVFKTSAGFFLIDTLNNTAEAQTYTVPALQQLGLNAAVPLIGAMPTHGHGDHFGGAQYLQSTFGIPVYLGSADAANKPFVVTPLDSANLAPQAFNVAPGTQWTLLSTPGHTPGTFSGVVPVHLNGVEYKIAFWGGTAMPNALAAARQYLDGAERFYALARDSGADGTMHTHPFVDGSLLHVDEIAVKGRVPSPFVLGKAQTLRSISMLRECSAAKVAQLDATAVIPVWRATTVEFSPQSPSPTLLSAKVQSGWGPVVGQTVKFSVGASGAACAATTDANGVATCGALPTLRANDVVTASYDGLVTASYVDLASSAKSIVATLQCDVDGNGTVNRNDINAIMAGVGNSAGASDARDADKDGRITIADARMCTLRCTKAQCAP